jgi:hypothetical protein
MAGIFTVYVKIQERGAPMLPVGHLRRQGRLRPVFTCSVQCAGAACGSVLCPAACSGKCSPAEGCDNCP